LTNTCLPRFCTHRPEMMGVPGWLGNVGARARLGPASSHVVANGQKAEEVPLTYCRGQ
jgi:hypothetical protein